jgi:hypothetical protein
MALSMAQSMLYHVAVCVHKELYMQGAVNLTRETCIASKSGGKYNCYMCSPNKKLNTPGII